MNLDKFFQDNPEWRIVADYIVAPPDGDELLAEFADCAQDVRDCALEAWHGGISRGTAYARFRREGSAHGWAAMLALQEAPRIMTDSVFFEGAKRPGDEFDASYLRTLKAAAKRQNFVIPTGAKYFSGLARFRGDKEAWITQDEGRARIKKLCEQRGWACDGAVTTQHRQPESDPHAQAIPMAEDLVRANARRMIAKNPDLKRLDKRELRQVVLEKHGQQKA